MKEVKNSNIDKVSIIVPVFNSEKTLAETIESLIRQIHKNVEIIIINDCSTDQSQKLIDSFKETYPDKIVSILFKENMGVSHARNCGIKYATGQYIAFCDSDDTWFKEKLFIQISAMKEKKYFCCHSSYLFCDSDLEPIHTISAKEKVTVHDMKFRNHVGNLTGIYDANKLGKFYQEIGLGHEDYDMWIKIITKENSLGIDIPLAKYRFHKESLSHNKVRSALWYFGVIKRNFGVMTAIVTFPVYVYSSLLKFSKR